MTVSDDENISQATKPWQHKFENNALLDCVGFESQMFRSAPTSRPQVRCLMTWPFNTCHYRTMRQVLQQAVHVHSCPRFVHRGRCATHVRAAPSIRRHMYNVDLDVASKPSGGTEPRPDMTVWQQTGPAHIRTAQLPCFQAFYQSSKQSESERASDLHLSISEFVMVLFFLRVGFLHLAPSP